MSGTDAALVQQLRWQAHFNNYGHDHPMWRAADVIDYLLAENARITELMRLIKLPHAQTRATIYGGQS